MSLNSEVPGKAVHGPHQNPQGLISPPSHRLMGLAVTGSQSIYLLWGMNSRLRYTPTGSWKLYRNVSKILSLVFVQNVCRREVAAALLSGGSGLAKKLFDGGEAPAAVAGAAAERASSRGSARESAATPATGRQATAQRSRLKSVSFASTPSASQPPPPEAQPEAGKPQGAPDKRAKRGKAGTQSRWVDSSAVLCQYDLGMLGRRELGLS